jgi:prepilin-type N-terminal cleavage/methylation domain-containing protein
VRDGLRILLRLRARGFVLLEVLVSLAILGIALSMIMKSLTTSLKAAKWSEQITTASVLARSLVEKWEIEAPSPGPITGTFGPNHPRYFYEADYRPEEIPYKDAPELEDAAALSPLRRISVRIYVGSEGAQQGRRQEVLRFETALIESELFEPNAKMFNAIPFE